MKNKYLFSVDLDATLLLTNKTITSSSKEYIQYLENNGHHFILNTGRPFQGAKEFLKELNLNEPLIANNGTSIVWFNEDYSSIDKVVRFSMDTTILKSFLHIVKPYLNNALLSSIYHMFTIDFKSLPFWIVHEDPLVKFIEGDLESIIDEDVIKAEFYVTSSYNDEFYKLITSSPFKDEFEFIYWGENNNICTYEVSKKGINKGYAMRYLIELYNVENKNTMSFGDQLNDIPMIEEANYGVSMINSRDEVKAKSHYISTYDNNNDGVIMFIKEHIKE